MERLVGKLDHGTLLKHRPRPRIYPEPLCSNAGSPSFTVSNVGVEACLFAYIELSETEYHQTGPEAGLQLTHSNFKNSR